MTDEEAVADRTAQHQAVLDILINHYGLLETAEDDMEGQPVLAQIYGDYETAVLWLIGALQRSLS